MEDCSKEFTDYCERALVMYEERETTIMSSNKLDSARIRVLFCGFPQCNFRSESEQCMSMHMSSHVTEQYLNWDYAKSDDELEHNNFHSTSHNNKDPNHHNIKSYNLIVKNLKKLNVTERKNQRTRKELDHNRLKDTSDLDSYYLSTPEGLAGPYFKCSKCELIIKRQSVYSLHVKTCKGHPDEAMGISEESDSSSSEDQTPDASQVSNRESSEECECESLLERALLEKTESVRPTELAMAKSVTQVSILRPSVKGNREEVVGRSSDMALKPKDDNNIVEADKSLGSQSNGNFRNKGEQVDLVKSVGKSACSNKAKKKKKKNAEKELEKICSKCPYILSGKPKRVGVHHVRLHSNPKAIVCSVPDCYYRTDKISHLKDHMGVHRRKSSIKSSERKVVQAVATEEPVHSKSLVSAQNPPKIVSSNSKNFPQCPHCPFQSKNFLRNHIALHSDPSALSCLVQGCYFKTKWPWYLKTHMNERHPKFKELPVIDKNGESEGAKMFGAANKDTGDQAQAAESRSPSPAMPELSPVVTLSQRNKDSSSPKAQGTNSEQSSVSTKGKSFTCSISGCNFETIYSANLSTHRRRKHSDPSRYSSQFLCPHPNCTHVSRWSSDLKKHIRRMHKLTENVKKLICRHDGCDFGTNVQRVLDRHAERIHREISVKKAPSSRIQHTSRMTQREGFQQDSSKFVCTAQNCEFNSRWPQSLKAHIVRKHRKVSAIVELTCGYRECDFKTNVQAFLDQHRRISHVGKPKVARTISRGKENVSNSRNYYQQNKPSEEASKSEKNSASCTFCSYASKLSFFLRKHFQPCPTCKSVNNQAVEDETVNSTATQIDNQDSPTSSSVVNPMLACSMCKFVADSQVQAAVHAGVHKRPIVLVARLLVIR